MCNAVDDRCLTLLNAKGEALIFYLDTVPWVKFFILIVLKTHPLTFHQDECIYISGI